MFTISAKKITFEVVPFKSSYHVIFGRPTYHKFHARACYIYNKLKIPGPKGATYQRTMQRCLKDQIGRNMHAYVDDIVVMTRKGSDLISNLTETFDNLRRSTGFTPFFLVYGSEAVLPSDIIHDSPRVSAYNEETDDEARQLSVDLIEEARNLADQRSAIYRSSDAITVVEFGIAPSWQETWSSAFDR
ncbi:hypothetical protein QYE76_015258 [Lolium multiflorum]|uniref:Reverse transcriptase domain-containing protein n=1 Tax=Lolium multiflorum TaxID=4521 RepID=A0AAD8U434_LOLMU|nr:hypothetical protein QYE76_015258 [Lolium multiflorum]